MNRLTVSIIVAVGASFALLIPFISFARHTVEDQIHIVGDILASIIPIVIALALIYFFWGLAKFILHADDETERAKGKNIMVWGIVALFVIVTIWGIIAVLQNTFIRSGNVPIAPGSPGLGGGGLEVCAGPFCIEL